MDLGLIANGTDDGLSADNDENINISDVIDVIRSTDPEFSEQNMYSGGGEVHGGPTVPQGAVPNLTPEQQLRRNAYVVITEQPASKALRFRYECEGRSAGSIPGENSTPENKTFPSIQIVGYRGRAFVVVSCVTKDKPYRAHPHNLVGKEGCKKGVCTMQVNTDTMSVTFSNLGIQCVKKKDIEEALKARELIKVDPFGNGFAHRSQPSNIDLNAVRLCFQVFLEDTPGKFTPLRVVVSNPIYDKKAMSDLVICTMSDCTASVAGGQRIILLCEKVAKEDIQVRLFEERDGQLIWEGFADFQHTDVHKQVAITFRTPKYRTLEVDRPVNAQIQLRRPSDSATSTPLKFQLLPLDSDPHELKRKRQKIDGDPKHLLWQLQGQNASTSNTAGQHLDYKLNIPLSSSPQAGNPMNQFDQSLVKTEPRDASPLPYMFTGGSYRCNQDTPSPQPFNVPYNNPSPLGADQTSQYNLPHYDQMNNFQNQQTIDWNAGLPVMNDLNRVMNIDPQAPIQGGPTSSMLDMDSQQLVQLNSGDLSGILEHLDRAQAIRVSADHENMTDSLSKLEMSALNNM
uniref:Putative transforming protein n=1 Tax=Xenopsylla cheopis TaxID=163159 RepID=A0A6M2DYI8_XENCH